MSKRQNLILLISLIAALVVIAILVYNKGDDELQWDFKGPVQVVANDADGATYVKVKGKGYALSSVKWAGFIKIQVGDTLIKKEGDKYIKVIKAGMKDTIYFNKEY